MQITNEQIKQSAKAVKEAYGKIMNQEISLADVKTSKISFKNFLVQLQKEPLNIIVMVYFIIYQFEKGTPQVAGNALIIFGATNDTPLDEAERSRLAEIGNILIGKYLGCLSDLTGRNLRASIQPIFKTMTTEAIKILEDQLFRGDLDEELSLTEINLNNKKEKTNLYIFIKK